MSSLIFKNMKAFCRRIYYHSKASDQLMPFFFLKCVSYRLRGKRIFAHRNGRIRGVQNIRTNGELIIGLRYVGFKHEKDPTYINVQGQLNFEGDFSIGKGCRLDIGPDAKVRIGKNGYITADTLVVAMHSVTIGDDCAISWNCQLLDDDFHQLDYPGRVPRTGQGIDIGNHVWIGSNTAIYKGARIPDGCVVAANSVVKGVFHEKNALIAGNPAEVVKKNVQWS